MLVAAVEGVVGDLSGRVLPFDEAAARCYAACAVRARSAGEGFPTPDGYIAAIAVARGFAVATRDGSAFRAAGVAVVDPWGE
jgi:predicted nucleic acid-binding protein